VKWPARVIASGRRTSVERAYVRGRSHAAGRGAGEPASWWGLCAALSSHYLARGRLRRTPALWAELVPFLLVPNEVIAEVALEEYIVYKSDRGAADLAWLGVEVNAALDHVDTFDERLAPLLEGPELMLDADWLALLSYQTLLRVRRAVSLYDGRSPHPARAKFWMGPPLAGGRPPAPDVP
jgi:hypothetical protein